MTKIIGYKAALTPFSIWVNSNCKGSTLYSRIPGHLTVSDVDFVFRDYDKMLLKLVEEKVLGKKHLERSQSEILKLVDSAFKDATRDGGALEGWKYEGFYIITFSKSDPEDSKQIFINGVEVDKDQLRRFINFDLKLVGLTMKG